MLLTCDARDIPFSHQVVTLTVGDDCDSNVAIMYGRQLSSYSCAVRVAHRLPERSVLQKKLICYDLEVFSIRDFHCNAEREKELFFCTTM